MANVITIATLLLCEPAAFSQESDSLPNLPSLPSVQLQQPTFVGASIDLAFAQSGNHQSVANGPLKNERKLVLARILEASRAGVGITPYLNEFNNIEAMVQANAPTADCQSRLNSLSDNLDNQLDHLRNSRPNSIQNRNLLGSAYPHRQRALIGRIEELSSTSGARFPELKALTPKLDTRSIARQSPDADSGKKAASYPVDFEGNWQGTLTIQQCDTSPTYWAIDPDEAAYTKKIMQVGMPGSADFVFTKRDGANVHLEPSEVAFSVEADQTDLGQQTMRQISAMPGGMAMLAQMQRAMANISIPISLHFGAVDTTGDPKLNSLSGNAIRDIVLKNNLEQLSDHTVEEQIITYGKTKNKRTGGERLTFGESVIRFTAETPDQLMVEAATVCYSPDRSFLYKVLLSGLVKRSH